MDDQVTKARDFAALHVQGNPVIIYNAWDGGSAKAIASAGAKAIATGDHPVGYAHGYGDNDFGNFSFETYLGTIRDIARVVTVPFSVDISNGEGLDVGGLQARVKTLLEIGVIGINFEDRLDDSSGVKPIDEQVELLTAIRTTADEFGVPLFVNARTDLFTTNDKDQHSDLVAEAVARAKAYQVAGASGFFAPALIDLDLIRQLCEQSPLPVNIIRLPGAPSAAELKTAGVSRISYGPVAQMEMIAWLKDKARDALQGNN